MSSKQTNEVIEKEEGGIPQLKASAANEGEVACTTEISLTFSGRSLNREESDPLRHSAVTLFAASSSPRSDWPRSRLWDGFVKLCADYGNHPDPEIGRIKERMSGVDRIGLQRG
jgi:hypothetical protein